MYARRTYQAPPWPAEKESQRVREDLGVHTVLTINKDLNKKKKKRRAKRKGVTVLRRRSEPTARTKAMRCREMMMAIRETETAIIAPLSLCLRGCVCLALIKMGSPLLLVCYFEPAFFLDACEGVLCTCERQMPMRGIESRYWGVGPNNSPDSHLI